MTVPQVCVFVNLCRETTVPPHWNATPYLHGVFRCVLVSFLDKWPWSLVNMCAHADHPSFTKTSSTGITTTWLSTPLNPWSFHTEMQWHTPWPSKGTHNGELIRLMEGKITSFLLNNDSLEEVAQFKYLGVIITDDLFLSKQVVSKARRILGMIYPKFYHFCGTSTLLRLYKAYVKPHLNYRIHGLISATRY